jgi:predicted Ser/Thr protein kinase
LSSSEDIFGGRYRIVGEVGRGGMGVIYRGVDTVLDREVAIKVMSGDFAETSEEARGRFFREAKAAAKLQHRNIVTVFEFAEQDGVPYIVMEFLKGKSLSARMSAQPSLTLDQKLDVMTELCNGLQFAHENGVIHRDVKPANVWILDDGTVKLVDFGIAKISSSMMTLRGDILGSAAYMAPEQIEGHEVTGRSDIFSAAVMLYEMVARKRPFEGDSPTATMMQIVQVTPPPIDSIAPGLPRELVAAIARGLEKNPDHRYQSAEEFGLELQLIRMALPRGEETVMAAATAFQPVRSAPSDATVLMDQLSFKGAPLPTAGPEARPSATGRGVSRPVMLGVGAVVLAGIVGGALWMNRGPEGTSAQTGTAGAATGGTTGRTGGGGGGSTTNVVERDIRVDSKPTGADVMLNGKRVGLTPANLKVAAGTSIRLQKRGVKSRDVEILQADLDRGSAVYELTAAEPTTVQVELSGSYPFEVRSGSELLSAASESHRISSQDGRQLRLYSGEHFLDKTITVAGQRGAASVKVPELGEVFLKGNESCLVFHGNTRLDYLRQPLPQMAEGAHLFRFQCSDGTKLADLRVNVVAGKRIEVDVR